MALATATWVESDNWNSAANSSSCTHMACTAASDVAVQAMCVQLLLFAALFQLSDSTQVAVASAIRGYKVTRGPMIIQLLAFWGVSLPVGCILGLAPGWFPWSPAAPLSATGFWMGLVLGLTVAAVLLTWAFQRLANQRIDAKV